MYYKISVCKMVAEDNYKDGEIGELTDFGELFNFTESRKDEIMNHIEAQTCFVPSDFEVFEGRLETSFLENKDARPPSEVEREAWKKGEINLYNGMYTIYITEIVENEIDAIELLMAS